MRTPIAIGVALVVLVIAFFLLRKQTAVSPPIVLTTPPVSQPRSIAVLPLTNIGGDKADADIAAGMTSALANAITRVPGLRVASQTAASSVRETQKTLPDIARALNVSMLLEGSVQHQREQLRVNVRVVNVGNDSTVWAGSFDGSTNDVFKVQDALTQAVASALQARLPAGTP